MREADVRVALRMLQSGRSDLIDCFISKSILRYDKVPRNKAIKDLLNIFLREQTASLIFVAFVA